MSNYSFPSDTKNKRALHLGRTLTRRVYDALREEILSGKLKPGERLVRKTLSKRLGVSPMPITEALYKLEIENLVESLPLCGSRVRPLTIEDIENDLMMREAIECQTARICAQRADEESLCRLQASAVKVDRYMAVDTPDRKLGDRLHFEFHLELAKASGFPIFVEELQRVWFQRYMQLTFFKAVHCRAIPADWHQSLIAVIRSRDPDQAERHMREHVRYGQENDRRALESYLQSVQADEDAPPAGRPTA
jgi:DNA-binding GntR family transcriptional regulator